MSSPEYPEGLALTFEALRSALFGDETLEEINLQSLSIGDTAKVLRLPVAIGKIIAQRDFEERFFHIEFFESHAEIWLIFEWKESNARRARFKSFHIQDNAARDKRAARISKIKEHLSDALLPHVKEDLAKNIVDNYKKYNFEEVLKALNVVEVLNEFEKEDNIT